MGILKSLSLGQLQTFNHVLQELEISNIPDLKTARLIVSAETEDRHIRRRLMGRKIKKNICPECGSQMLLDEIDDLEILECRQCFLSKIIGGN